MFCICLEFDQSYSTVFPERHWEQSVINEQYLIPNTTDCAPHQKRRVWEGGSRNGIFFASPLRLYFGVDQWGEK